jgi:acetylornithine/succinyldiaminopimelate/putrescine aminotransferase
MQNDLQKNRAMSNSMSFDIKKLIADHLDEAGSLYGAHVNPKFAKALQIIGFDKTYVSAKGAYLFDRDGIKYLDMLAGYGMYNIGRNHPVVQKALGDFIAEDFSSLVQMETPVLCGVLARELKKRIGYDLEKVYFCSTGAEANETALKFARRATGKNTVIYASSAFHGLTTGALSMNGSEVFKENFGDLTASAKIPLGDLTALELELAKGDVAAFFVEPVQGKGVNMPATGFLGDAARLCHKYGALLVIDEVQCGIGRTGKFLALHHEPDVDPDIVIVSKSLSGGYIPIAAVVMKESVFAKTFSSLDRAVVHSSTFGKSNFAMTAGLATLHVLDEENLMENAQKMGDLLGQRLLAVKDKYEFIKDVRWRGLMLAIEFGKPKSLKLKTAWATVNKINEDLFCQAITIPLLQDHQILTQVAGNKMTTIKLIPPLCLDEGDIDWFMNGFEAVMDDLHKFPGPAWESLTRIAKNALGKSTPAKGSV